MKNARAELALLQRQSAAVLAADLADAGRANLNDSKAALFKSQKHLARSLAMAQALADLLGQRRLLLDMKQAGLKKSAKFQQGEPELLSLDTLRAAVESITSRDLRLAWGWKQARDQYEEGAFSLARSASLIVTRHIRNAIARSIEDGVPRDTATNKMAEILGARQLDVEGASFVRSYADTAFRTVTTGAYNEGRIRMSKDKDVRKFLGGWRFDATLDGDVRPNHRAADGFIAAIDDPVWQELRPPLGYNCRCALAVVLKDEVGELPVRSSPPPGAGPDVGFRA